MIRLARPEPLRIAERTIVVLEHAGDLTLARKLRDDGRLTVDELETYSDYLFGTLDYLEGRDSRACDQTTGYCIRIHGATIRR